MNTIISVLSIVINNVVIIAIAIFTYRYIDRRNILRQKNQEEVATVFLKSIYENCKKNVELFNDKKIEQSILKKTDFDKPFTKSEPIGLLETSAFSDEQIIIESFKNGVISGSLLEDYMAMKAAYQSYMICRVTFFDVPELYTPLESDFYRKYDVGMNHIRGTR